MITSVVTSKGQIVIPSKIRTKFKIKKGTKICFIEQGENIILKPITDDYVDRVKGVLKTNGRALKNLLDEKKKEQEL